MKKITGFILTLMLTLLVFATGATTASAAGDTIATATSISTGTTYSGSITETSDREIYKFTIPSSGRINIKLDASIYRTSYYLYNANGDTVWAAERLYWNGTTEIMSMDENIDLTKGTYYFAVVKYDGTGNFNFKINFTSANESFSETLYGNNQTVSTANAISLAKSYKGQIAINDDKDIYKFTLTSSGRINIKLDASIYRTSYYLYDANGDTIWAAERLYWNGTTGIMAMDQNIDLTKGTYYFAVVRYDGTGNYNFKINFTSAGESFSETLYGNNQTVNTANAISLAKSYKGQIAINDDKDIYKFTLTSSGRINIKLDASIYRTSYYLYDANGDTIWAAERLYWNGTTGIMAMDQNIDLTKGTYYFAVVRYDGTGNYNFKINFTSAGESFAETLYGNNQEIATASSISTDKTYKGQIAINDDKDIYKFTLKKGVQTRIKITAYVYRIDYCLYDQNGQAIWSRPNVYWNGTSQESKIDETIDLSAGTYYFAVVRHDGTGNYNFSIGHTHNSNSKSVTKATLTKNGKILTKCSICGSVIKTTTVYSPKSFKLSASSYTCDGKTKAPTVTIKTTKGKTLKSGTDYTVKYESGRKNPGKYTVTITFRGNYSGSKKLTFTIVPAATSKLSVTGQTTSSVSIKWNKVAGATGYRVFRMKKGEWVKLADTTKLTYTDKKLNSGSTYKYAVKAYGKQGETLIWATKYKQVETSTKPATSTLKVTSTAKGKATLTWSNPSGESGFEIYYSTKKDSGFKKIATTKANSTKATVSKLQSKKTYYFKVRSFKTTQSGKAYSAYSAVKSIKVK